MLSGLFKSERPMKFPYTFTAKAIQFPWAFYVKNNWMWKYYFIAGILCLPIFKKIDNLANSPANKAKWMAQQLKDAEEHH